MVVKMLIDKDPSLEKSIQFALRQNLHEIGERCIEELKHFIAQYDAANQDLSESFKEGPYWGQKIAFISSALSMP